MRSRNRKQARDAQAAAQREQRTTGTPPTAAPKKKLAGFETGLQVLRRAGRLDARQVAVGERYGRMWREAGIEGEATLRSSLAALESGGGGSGGGALTKLLSVERLVQVRRELLAAQEALGFESAMIAACDVICGKQWIPSQVSPVRREQEAIATLLWAALNILDRHFAAARSSGQSGPDVRPA